MIQHYHSPQYRTLRVKADWRRVDSSSNWNVIFEEFAQVLFQTWITPENDVFFHTSSDKLTGQMHQLDAGLSYVQPCDDGLHLLLHHLKLRLGAAKPSVDDARPHGLILPQWCQAIHVAMVINLHYTHANE